MEPEHPFQRSDRFMRINLSLTEETSQIIRRFQFQIPFFQQARAIKINDVIIQLRQRGFFREAQFFLYDHINRMKVFLGIFPPTHENIMIQTQHIIGDCLHLSFRQIRRDNYSEGMMQQQNLEGCAFQDSKINTEKNKKKKQARERTINQAVESVRLWRNLYDTADENGKRLYTLNEAAEKVGIPKKTLDDYFMKIRIAAKFDFHFQKMKYHKFGLLRNFVKVAKEQGIQKLKQKYSECLLENDIDKYWVDFDLL